MAPNSPENIEREFPHIVEMAVPRLGKRLDAVNSWLQQRGVQAHQGRHQQKHGQDYFRWCFADAATAADFRDAFGGSIIPTSKS
jgi:aspartate/methionine/tyrosine aminotransferase